MQTPGKFSSLDRQATALTSMGGRGVGKYGASRMSIGSECDEYGKVKSGGVAPLFWDFLDGLAFSLASYVGSSLLGWMKNSLDEENPRC